MMNDEDDSNNNEDDNSHVDATTTSQMTAANATPTPTSSSVLNQSVDNDDVTTPLLSNGDDHQAGSFLNYGSLRITHDDDKTSEIDVHGGANRRVISFANEVACCSSYDSIDDDDDDDDNDDDEERQFRLLMMTSPSASSTYIQKQTKKKMRRKMTYESSIRTFQSAVTSIDEEDDDSSVIRTRTTTESSPFLLLKRSSSVAAGSARKFLRRFRKSFRETIIDPIVTPSATNKPCDIKQHDSGKATMLQEIINLIKNLTSAAAMGLPAGIATIGNEIPTVPIVGCAIICIMAILFGYYFFLMGQICSMTQTTSYREAWEVTMGKKHRGFSSILVATCTLLMASCGCLCYSVILSNTTRAILQTIGTNHHIHSLMGITRGQCLIGLTIFVLLPLCLVKGLKALAPFSSVGAAGMIFTAIAMAIRYYDHSYDEGGKFYDEIPESSRPQFGNDIHLLFGCCSSNTNNNSSNNDSNNKSVLLIVWLTFQTYVAQYNSPRYYVELKHNTLRRFGIVVVTAFTITVAIYISIAAYGFLTFGEHSNGIILKNYSHEDVLAITNRIAITVALTFTYPLVFMGVRDGFLDLILVPVSKQTSSLLNLVTIVLLAVITTFAMYIEDLGLIKAIAGGILGTAVVFVFPTLMFRKAIQKQLEQQLHSSTSSTIIQRSEVTLANILMYISIAIAVIAVRTAIFATTTATTTNDDHTIIDEGSGFSFTDT